METAALVSLDGLASPSTGHANPLNSASADNDDDTHARPPPPTSTTTGPTQHVTTATRPSSYPAKLLASFIYCCTFAGLGLVVAAPGPCLLAMGAQTSSSVEEVSILFIFRAGGYFVGCVLGGILLDKLPKRGNALLALALLFTAACTSLVPKARAVWVLALLISTQGFAMGWLDTCGNVQLIQMWEKQVDPYMHALHFSFGLGAFASPLILRAVMDGTNEYGAAYYVFGIYLAIFGTILLVLPNPRRSERRRRGAAEAEGGNKQQPPRRLDQPQSGGMSCTTYCIKCIHRILGAHMSPREIPIVLCTACFLGIYVGLEVSYGGFVFAYGVKHAEMSEPTSQLLTSVFWGSLAFGRLVAIPLSLRISPVQMMFGDLIGCVVACSWMLLWPNSNLVLWVTSAAFGLAMASIFPTSLNVAETVMDVSGKVASLFIVGASLGEMVIPAVMGTLFTNVGPRLFPWYACGVSILQAVVFIILLKFVRRCAQQQQKGGGGGGGVEMKEGAAAGSTFGEGDRGSNWESVHLDIAGV